MLGPSKRHAAAGGMNRRRLALRIWRSQSSLILGGLSATRKPRARKHDGVIKELYETRKPEEVKVREEISTDLLLDAARKAENTRAKERVKRIGMILANAVVDPKRRDADEAEEMMRVAMELSDRDVQLLGELVRIEGAMLQTQPHIPRYQAHQAWEHGFWGTHIDPEIDSVFSKLESYGLVSRIPPPNNLNIMADYQNRYVLLRKGLRFVTLTRQAAAGQ